MQLTVAQTRGGIFSRHIIRRDDGLFLADDGSFGGEEAARQFSDLRHAADVADALMGQGWRVRLRELLDADAEASERECDPAVDKLSSRGQRLAAFRTGLQELLRTAMMLLLVLGVPALAGPKWPQSATRRWHEAAACKKRNAQQEGLVPCCWDVPTWYDGECGRERAPAPRPSAPRAPVERGGEGSGLSR